MGCDLQPQSFIYLGLGFQNPFFFKRQGYKLSSKLNKKKILRSSCNGKYEKKGYGQKQIIKKSYIYDIIYII